MKSNQIQLTLLSNLLANLMDMLFCKKGSLYQYNQAHLQKSHLNETFIYCKQFYQHTKSFSNHLAENCPLVAIWSHGQFCYNEWNKPWRSQVFMSQGKAGSCMTRCSQSVQCFNFILNCIIFFLSGSADKT